MKLQPVSKRNLLGLNTVAKKVDYAFRTLIGGTNPNPKTVVAKPAVAAVAAIIGTGTAANPQFPAVAAKAAIMTPVVMPPKEWIDTCWIDEDDILFNKYTCWLPYSPAAIAMGATMGNRLIQEVSPAALDLAWVGSLASTAAADTEFLVDGKIGTLEQFLYSNCLLLTPIAGHINKVEKSSFKVDPSSTDSLEIPAIVIEVYILKSDLVDSGSGGT